MQERKRGRLRKLRRLHREPLRLRKQEHLKLLKEKQSRRRQLKKSQKRISTLLRKRKKMRSLPNWSRLILRKRSAYKLKRKQDRKNG